MQHYLYTSCITLLTVLLMFGLTFNVGRARGKYHVPAPAVSGNEMFERAYRIQLNTIENVMMFLPVLWLYAIFLSEKGAGYFGLIWLVARVWYAITYQSDPAKRALGFVVSVLVIIGLWAGAAYGIYGQYIKLQ